MTFTLRWRVGAVLSLAFSLFGCRDRDPPVPSPQPVVRSHGKGQWWSAQVQVIVERGFRGSHSTYYPRVKHVLLLNKESVVRKLELGRFFRAEDPLGGGLPDADYQARARANFTLVFSEDDHALAISSDGGTSWNYIALDLGEEAMFCPHVVFKGSDPWSTAPTTRALVLDILDARSPHRHADDKELRGDETDKSGFEHELRGAGRFLCQHPEDTDVRRAFAKALVWPGRPLPLLSETRRAQLPCLQKAAVVDDVFRSVLVEALQSGDPRIETEQLFVPSQVLAVVPDETVQSALARALAAALKRGSTETGECHLVEALSRSLANVTVLRRTGPDSVRAVFADLIREPNVCSEANESSVLGARIHAVRGLAALPQPAARAAVAAVAREACSRTPPSPLPFDDWRTANDEQGRELELPCWARGVLAAKASPKN